jgi:hypothetical protein
MRPPTSTTACVALARATFLIPSGRRKQHGACRAGSTTWNQLKTVGLIVRPINPMEDEHAPWVLPASARSLGPTSHQMASQKVGPARCNSGEVPQSGCECPRQSSWVRYSGPSSN